MPATTMQRMISYSDKYEDDQFEYRHVVLPTELVKQVPKLHLMTETEWRNLGVQQSPGWVHYMIHNPGVCRNHQLLARMQPLMTSRVTMAMTAKQEQDKFWEKNKKLNRPLSPHLTIYSPQVTSMLSITHRGTGVGLTVGLYALGISMSVLPHDFAYYLDLVKSLSYGPSLIFLTKLAIVWPVAYHTLNGVRHLAWDTGYGFDIKTLYKTGYLVLGLSFAITAGIAML